MKWLILRILIFFILSSASLLFLTKGQELFDFLPGITSNHFLFLWGAFLATMLLPYLFGIRFFSRIVLVLLIFLVLAGTLTTRSFRFQIVSQVREQVHAIFRQKEPPSRDFSGDKKAKSLESGQPARQNRDLPRFVYRANKTGHFILFALLTLTLLTVSAPGRWVIVLADVLLLAGSTEMMQLFVQGRAAGVGDFYLDAGGGALGFFLWLLGVAWRSRDGCRFS